MSYLRDFLAKINQHDYAAFLKIWEEYCHGDEVDPEELYQVLLAVKHAEFAAPFGAYVDRIIPLWSALPSSPISEDILRLIVDIQTTNSSQLADLVFSVVQEKYEKEKFYKDALKLTGLRGRENFQGALRAFALLAHFKIGNFVFHTGGWGIGEIRDISFLREQVSIEFDRVAGFKDLSFVNAFKVLIPIAKENFLAMRFGNADLLEKQAKEDPTAVIRMLLRDLGPKSAAEIKEELCDFVIPSATWARWWQGARTKLKKDTMIEVPTELKDPFRLRKAEIAYEEQLLETLEKNGEADFLIQTVYAFLRDFPEALKKSDFRSRLEKKLNEVLAVHELTHPQELQVHLLLEDLGQDREKVEVAVQELLKRFQPTEELVQKIGIVAFRKRILVGIKKHLPEWIKIFLNLLYVLEQNSLRDFLLQELQEAAPRELEIKLRELLDSPAKYPDAFLWYFHKLIPSSELPFSDQEGKSRFFEAFLILLSEIENVPERRDSVKKMHGMLIAGRYAIVRQVMQKASLEEVKEFLLLATKCHSLSDHDIKIFYSLAEVVHPKIGLGKKRDARWDDVTDEVIWTTQAGYQTLQQRIQQIATVETVEVAEEIKVARSHGDLRENSEFKFALEKRERMQAELKLLSNQLNKARILTKEDVITDEVDVGVIVDCKTSDGELVSYTLLGPWDADPERNILSFQSKLAQSMKGLGVGGAFQVQGDTHTIVAIRSYFA
jgi:transcription elongation factor GreA-like protein/transcription elongation GreA/GreB family factor